MLEALGGLLKSIDWGKVAGIGMNLLPGIMRLTSGGGGGSYGARPSPTYYQGVNPLWQYLSALNQDYVRKISYDLGFQLGPVTRRVFNTIMLRMAGGGHAGEFLSEMKERAREAERVWTRAPSYTIGVRGGPRITGVKPLGAIRTELEPIRLSAGLLEKGYAPILEAPFTAGQILAPYQRYAPYTETMHYTGRPGQTMARLGTGLGLLEGVVRAAGGIWDVIKNRGRGFLEEPEWLKTELK